MSIVGVTGDLGVKLLSEVVSLCVGVGGYNFWFLVHHGVHHRVHHSHVHSHIVHILHLHVLLHEHFHRGHLVHVHSSSIVGKLPEHMRSHSWHSLRESSHLWHSSGHSKWSIHHISEFSWLAEVLCRLVDHVQLKEFTSLALALVVVHIKLGTAISKGLSFKGLLSVMSMLLLIKADIAKDFHGSFNAQVRGKEFFLDGSAGSDRSVLLKQFS
mmetsp:Transcript_30990/g.32181  ORF Transcript_30990/g.32181 Transcript_30990/m.32181 type:complete len:213 (+) Transcript_30990:282-920(+)